MNYIVEIVSQYLPFGTKLSPSGWTSMNCPCCTSAGESRPDTRHRGGILYTDTGGVQYHCFNCKTKAGWEPGFGLSKNFIFVMKNFGVPTEEIRKAKFKAWQIRGQMELDISPEYKPDWHQLKFPTLEMPEGARLFSEWVKEDNPPKNFLDAANYVNDRGEGFLGAYNYYWSPSLKHGLNRRVIIPFYWKGNLVGWNARLIKGDGDRYYGDIPSNFLFNSRVIGLEDRKFIIVVEGLFDAIAIDGVGACGGSLTKEQIQWLNSSGQEIILVPDKDKAGQALIDIAIKEGWSVSIPIADSYNLSWDADIEDVADAVQRYGRLYTLRSIIDNRTTNKMLIKSRRKDFTQ